MVIAKKPLVQTGLDVFLQEGVPQIAGKRVGLITNYTGVNCALQSGAELLHASDQVQLCALFGPEHGILGNVQDALPIEGSVDARTGLPVYSLYGATEKPMPEWLEGLDALIFDIQDVGVRYYTYPSTMAFAQEAAAESGLDFVVFDRPNPVTGLSLDGNILDMRFASFVGAHSVPIRHGMTIGELARLFAAERGYPEPIVVAMRGWRRSMWFDETGLPWVLPSPNFPTLETAVLYPGTCLIEGTNLSEGRGTTKPFELLGAPWLDPFALIDEMEHYHLPGVALRPAYFTPTYPKLKDVLCSGVQVHVLERDQVRPVELGLSLLYTLSKLHPEQFDWIKHSSGGYFIDHLLGSDQPRQALDAGADVPTVMAGWSEACTVFAQRRQPYLLYGEKL